MNVNGEWCKGRGEEVAESMAPYCVHVERVDINNSKLSVRRWR